MQIENPKQRTTTSPLDSDSSEGNKAAVRRLYEECINEGKLQLADELIAPEFVTPGPDGGSGPDGFRANLARLRTGFPDIRFTLHELLAEQDGVAVYWTWSGTHRGTFAGIPATGKPVRQEGMVMYRFKAKSGVGAVDLRPAGSVSANGRHATGARSTAAFKPAITMKTSTELNEALRGRILELAGVTEKPNAGIHEDAFFVGRTMFMHIHGQGHCDIRLSKEDQARVLAEGKAQTHRWSPQTGYVTFLLKDHADLEPAMELIRFSHRHFAVAPAEE